MYNITIINFHSVPHTKLSYGLGRLEKEHTIRKDFFYSDLFLLLPLLFLKEQI